MVSVCLLAFGPECPVVELVTEVLTSCMVFHLADTGVVSSGFLDVYVWIRGLKFWVLVWPLMEQGASISGVGWIGSLGLGIWVLALPLVGQGVSTGSVGYYRVRRRRRTAGVSQGMFWGMVGGP